MALEQENTNEPMSRTCFCEHKSFCPPGDCIIESQNHGVAWVGRDL